MVKLKQIQAVEGTCEDEELSLQVQFLCNRMVSFYVTEWSFLNSLRVSSRTVSESLHEMSMSLFTTIYKGGV